MFVGQKKHSMAPAVGIQWEAGNFHHFTLWISGIIIIQERGIPVNQPESSGNLT